MSRWRIGPCRCPTCKKQHADYIYNKAPRVRDDNSTIPVRQECDACLRRRVGEVGYARYKEAMSKVRL